MRLWTNNKFKGYWPVGTAAVVVAKTAEEAADYLSMALDKKGLGNVKIGDMKEIDFSDGTVEILCDGNY